MKKLIYGALFLALVGIVMVGCEKDKVNNSEIKSNKIATQKKDKIITNKSNETAAAVKISCDGSCDGSGDGCGMLIQGMPVEFVECDCEGCSMTFSGVNNIPFDQSLSTNFELVAVNIDDYLDLTYPNQIITLTTIYIYKKSNNDIVIQVDYESDDGSVDANITYLLEFLSSGELSNKLEIDCSGGCTDEADTCRERYYPASGSVECTCEGDCSMSVTEVPN
jgi:hypothetical protein